MVNLLRFASESAANYLTFLTSLLVCYFLFISTVTIVTEKIGSIVLAILEELKKNNDK